MTAAPDEVNFDLTFQLKSNEDDTPQSRPVPRRPIKSGSSSGRRLGVGDSSPARAIAVPGGRSLPLSLIYKHSNEVSYMEQCFDAIKCVGEGSFGIVYQGRSKDDDKYYAIKQYREKFRSETQRESRLNEVKRYGRLPQNNYICEFFRAWEEDGVICVQMELCRFTLEQYIGEERDVPIDRIWNILLDILLGVYHLHVNGFMHLDIKPANILVSSNDVCKLGDFGLMLEVSKAQVNSAHDGDARYLAAEVLQGVYTKAADIFSIGITILEVVTMLKLPSSGVLWHKLRTGNLPCEYFPSSSYEILECVKLMMLEEPSQRPSVEEVLSLNKLRGLYRKRRVYGFINNMTSQVKCFLKYGRMIATNFTLSLIKPFKTKVDFLAQDVNESNQNRGTNVSSQEQTTPPPSRCSVVQIVSTPRDRTDYLDLAGTPRSVHFSCRKRIVFSNNGDAGESDEDEPSLGLSKRRIVFSDNGDAGESDEDEPSLGLSKRRLVFSDNRFTTDSYGNEPLPGTSLGQFVSHDSDSSKTDSSESDEHEPIPGTSSGEHVISDDCDVSSSDEKESQRTEKRQLVVDPDGRESDENEPSPGPSKRQRLQF